MCLLFIYINPNPKKGEFRVILVNNRDEFYARPTKSAHKWKTSPEIIAGMDIFPGREGGTWVGMNSNGKIGSLLNILQSVEQQKLGKSAQGRGFLVVNYLLNNDKGETYLKEIVDSGVVYNDFNLVLLEPSENETYQGHYLNVGGQPIKLAPGVHGFGNSHKDRPFLKVKKGIDELQRIVEDTTCNYLKEENLTLLKERLVSMMKERTSYYPDPALSLQGKGHPENFIKGLSSPWIELKEIKYGTRTTTMIVVDSNNKAHYHEQTMEEPIDLGNLKWTDNQFDTTLRTT